MAAIDSVVRALVEKQLNEPVLAIARFQVAGPDTGIDSSAVQLFSVGGWLVRRRQAGWPTPAFIAVCQSTVTVFSARVGRSTRLLGPLIVWPREAIAAKVGDDGYRVTIQPVRNRPAFELEAVEPGPDAASVIRYLCNRMQDDA